MEAVLQSMGKEALSSYMTDSKSVRFSRLHWAEIQRICSVTGASQSMVVRSLIGLGLEQANAAQQN